MTRGLDGPIGFGGLTRVGRIAQRADAAALRDGQAEGRIESEPVGVVAVAMALGDQVQWTQDEVHERDAAGVDDHAGDEAAENDAQPVDAGHTPLRAWAQEYCQLSRPIGQVGT